MPRSRVEFSPPFAPEGICDCDDYFSSLTFICFDCQIENGLIIKKKLNNKLPGNLTCYFPVMTYRMFTQEPTILFHFQCHWYLSHPPCESMINLSKFCKSACSFIFVDMKIITYRKFDFIFLGKKIFWLVCPINKFRVQIEIRLNRWCEKKLVGCLSEWKRSPWKDT